LKDRGFNNCYPIDDKSEHCDTYFCEPNSPDDYQPRFGDILFIAWGRHLDFVDEFIAGGGHRIVIVGERSGGCTLPCDLLADDPAWDVDLVEVPSSTGQKQFMSLCVKRGQQTLPGWISGH
jgi:hypothetical protein